MATGMLTVYFDFLTYPVVVIGYLLTSNNWHSIFTENEEVVSCGQYAGESVAKGYIELVKSVK